MARASLQSGKLVMAACQEAGDRCAATLTGLCRPVMCSDEKHGDNQAWELGQVTLGNRPGYSRYPIAGSISPCCPRCLGEGKVVSGRLLTDGSGGWESAKGNTWPRGGVEAGGPTLLVGQKKWGGMTETAGLLPQRLSEPLP